MYRTLSYLWTWMGGMTLSITLLTLVHAPPAGVAVLVSMTLFAAGMAGLTKMIADREQRPKFTFLNVGEHFRSSRPSKEIRE